MTFSRNACAALGLMIAPLCGLPTDAASTSPASVEATRIVSPDAAHSIELAPDLDLRRIGPGAYVIAHRFPFLCNSVLVEMPDGTLVFGGTPCTPEATQQVLDWAAREFGPRRTVAIDSGYHVDNLGGNQAFLDAGIPVHGSDLTVRLLAERGEKTRGVVLGFIADKQSHEYATHAALKFVPPDHVFPIAQGLTLTFGGEEVRVIYPGPTQAPDKVAVYFPGRKLLYGSCMILAGDRPGNIAEADLARWPDAIRSLQSLPVTVVVSAHGERLDPGLLQHTIDLLARR